MEVFNPEATLSKERFRFELMGKMPRLERTTKLKVAVFLILVHQLRFGGNCILGHLIPK
tara:strand:+ start:28463 stop:28639 length:177 start_codon:yes stop_codon:yes gene_type:complete